MQARPNIWPNKSSKDMPVMPHELMNTVKTLLSQISKLCINFTISSNEVYNSILQYKSSDIMNLRDTKHFLHQSRYINCCYLDALQTVEKYDKFDNLVTYKYDCL